MPQQQLQQQTPDRDKPKKDDVAPPAAVVQPRGNGAAQPQDADDGSDSPQIDSVANDLAASDDTPDAGDERSSPTTGDEPGASGDPTEPSPQQGPNKDDPTDEVVDEEAAARKAADEKKKADGMADALAAMKQISDDEEAAAQAKRDADEAQRVADEAQKAADEAKQKADEERQRQADQARQDEADEARWKVEARVAAERIAATMIQERGGVLEGFQLTTERDPARAQQILENMEPEARKQIRQAYWDKTGRLMENDLWEHKDSGEQGRHSVALLWDGMTLAERNSYMDTPQATLDNIEDMKRDDPKRFERQSQTERFQKQLDELPVRERLEALATVDPNSDKLYQLVGQQLWNGSREHAFEGLAKLPIARREEMLENNPKILDRFSKNERTMLKLMDDSEHQALRARMWGATAGWGTWDDNLAALTKDTEKLLAEEKKIQIQLDDERMPEDKRREGRARLEEMGNIAALLVPKRESDGYSLQDGTFLEMMQGDVGESEFLQKMEEMGASALNMARQTAAAELDNWIFSPDMNRIKDKFAEIKDPEERSKGLEAGMKTELEDQAGVDEVADLQDDYIDGTQDTMGTDQLERQLDYFNPDMVGMFKAAQGMTDEGRETFKNSPAYAKLKEAVLDPRERAAMDQLLETGQIDLSLSLRAAAGEKGIADGTNEELMEFVLANQTPEQGRRTAIAMDLIDRDVDPSTPEEQEAYDEFEENWGIVKAETSGKDFRNIERKAIEGATHARTFTPIPEDATHDERKRLLEQRQQDLQRAERPDLKQQNREMDISMGASRWFSDTDETANNASVAAHAQNVHNMRDKNISEEEHGAFEQDDKKYQERHKEMVDAQAQVTDWAVTAATVTVGIIATVASFGTLGPLAAALVVGGSVTGTKLVTGEIMAGDNHDTNDAVKTLAMAPVEVAAAYGAGLLLKPMAGILGVSTEELAEMSTKEVMKRMLPALITKEYLENFASNSALAVGENFLEDGNAQQDIWGILKDASTDIWEQTHSMGTILGTITSSVLAKPKADADVRFAERQAQQRAQNSSGDTPATPEVHMPRTPTTGGEAPRTQTPDVDAPRAQTPDVEAPRAQTPDVEAPKTDVEAPKTDGETARSDVDTPKTDVDTPKTDVDTPKTDVDTPKTDVETRTADAEALRILEDARGSDTALEIGTRERTALREHIKKHGVPTTIEELGNIKGLGKTTLEALRAKVRAKATTVKDVDFDQRQSQEVVEFMRSATDEVFEGMGITGKKKDALLKRIADGEISSPADLHLEGVGAKTLEKIRAQAASDARGNRTDLKGIPVTNTEGRAMLDLVQKSSDARITPSAIEAYVRNLSDADAIEARELLTNHIGESWDQAMGSHSAEGNHTALRAGEMNTVEAFTANPMPEGGNPWEHYADPNNWTPGRRQLHDQIIARAVQQALAFDQVVGGEPTIYATRGNTGSGKTRALDGQVTELQPAMRATESQPHRAVNPDNFKVDLYAATPDMPLNSTQVHLESSILADRLKTELAGLTRADGSPVSMMVDSRLAGPRDLNRLADIAAETGRAVNVYDVDAPLEASMAGVLARPVGGDSPIPPLSEIAENGFVPARKNRAEIMQRFVDDPTLGKYELYGTQPDGSKVLVARVDGGELHVENPKMFTDLTTDPSAEVAAMRGQSITEDFIESYTQNLPEGYAETMRDALTPYVGQSWEDAIAHHAGKKTTDE